MNLYQIDWKKLTEGLDDKALLFIEGCVEPAKPCEHGKYDGHFIDTEVGGYVSYSTNWCPGAAVGEETP